LATLLITAEPPVATTSSHSGGNPSAAVPGNGEFYGDGWNNYGHDVDPPKPAQKGDFVAPHQEIPSAHYGL
jgi:hypothetical protein